MEENCPSLAINLTVFCMKEVAQIMYNKYSWILQKTCGIQKQKQLKQT